MRKSFKNRKLKIVFLVISIVLAVFFGVAFVFYSLNKPPKLEVDFLDVGQGDATLIKTPAGQMILIDGGPDNKVLRRLGENLPFYRRQIDLIILSHYHDDHAAGLVEIVKRYKVGKIIIAADSPTSPILAALEKIAKKQSISFIFLDKQASLNLSAGCSLNLLNPISLGIKTDPNNSLVAKLACGGRTFLFPGDNSLSVEKALIGSGWDLRAAILKASHHGSNSANSEAFLRAVIPQLLIISVGADNKFGHPSPAILERAANLVIDVKRTDESKTVRILGP